MIFLKRNLGQLLDNDASFNFDPVNTYETLEHFWFPRLRNFVKNYIRRCQVCTVKKTRTGPLKCYLSQVEKSSTPFETLHAVHPVSYNFKYILVLVDAFTK